jgi:DeoR/GlpR family transcriptional regulator of sugar metabolism
MSSEQDQEDTGNVRYRSAGHRQARLIELLRSEIFADAQVLRDRLGVSIATVRRDLTELEAKGFLKRTHGGATIINQVMRDSSVAVRELTNSAEKAQIAESAAELIADGDAIIIDSGTTSQQVARLLASNTTLTFVTNGIDVLRTLVEGGARNVHIIGGEYVDINHSCGGPLAAEQVRRFNVDKAILSVSSFDVKRGLICTLSPQIGSVQQAMIEIAQETIVVADHSKFERTALTVIESAQTLDYIVTNEATRPLVADMPDAIFQKFIFA